MGVCAGVHVPMYSDDLYSYGQYSHGIYKYDLYSVDPGQCACPYMGVCAGLHVHMCEHANCVHTREWVRVLFDLSSHLNEMDKQTDGDAGMSPS